MKRFGGGKFLEGRIPVRFSEAAIAVGLASVTAFGLILPSTWRPGLSLMSGYVVFSMVVAATVLLAWLRAGRWERLAAGTLAVNAVVTGAFQGSAGNPYADYVFLAGDVVQFGILVAIVLRSRLWWAIWAAGFLLFGIIVHLAMIVDQMVTPYAYYTGLAVSYDLVLAAIMVGAWTHKRE